MNFKRGIKEIVRCVHRHTIDEHPACFAQGAVVDGRKPADREIPWFQEPGLRIGYLDIEVDNLKADFGTILTWCIKEKEGGISSAKITRRDITSKNYDKDVTQLLIDELNKYSIIVTYYGTNFDIPFVRSRALYHNLEFPAFGKLYHWDLYYTVKSKLKLHNSTLRTATKFLGIAGKTEIEWEAWRDAKYGDDTALAEVMSHNEGDVEILELLHQRLQPFQKWTKKSV